MFQILEQKGGMFKIVWGRSKMIASTRYAVCDRLVATRYQDWKPLI